MVAVIVDNRVDVPIVGSALCRVGRDEPCALRDLELAAVNLADIDGTHCFACVREHIHDNNTHHVADVVRLFDQQLTATSPDGDGDQPAILSISKATINGIDQEGVALGHTEELCVHHSVRHASLRVLDAELL